MYFKTFWAVQDKNRRYDFRSGEAGYMAANAARGTPNTITILSNSINSAATKPAMDSIITTLTAATKALYLQQAVMALMIANYAAGTTTPGTPVAPSARDTQ